MSKRFRDLNQNGVNFLLVDLDAAMTFMDVAQTSHVQETVWRNHNNARKAYDTVLRLLEKLDALAKLVGLTRTSLTNIENGRQHPPLHTLCEIVEQLEVEFAELLPRPVATLASIDVEALAGLQVRGENELAFIETAIGIKGRKPHGSTASKDSSDSPDTTR